jgi:hypothetical protein
MPDISGKMIDDQTFNGHADANIHCINEKISGNETVLIAQFCVQGSCESFKLVNK